MKSVKDTPGVYHTRIAFQQAAAGAVIVGTLAAANLGLIALEDNKEPVGNFLRPVQEWVQSPSVSPFFDQDDVIVRLSAGGYLGLTSAICSAAAVMGIHLLAEKKWAREKAKRAKRLTPEA